jgi:hypothetical protein
MSAWTEIAVGVTTGLGTGVLASVLSPWAQWGVEKRRRQMDQRAAIIHGARRLVAERQPDDRSEILRDPRYLAIRPHLDPEVEAKLRAQGIVAVRDTYGTVGNNYLALIRDEADRLEKAWT